MSPWRFLQSKVAHSPLGLCFNEKLGCGWTMIMGADCDDAVFTAITEPHIVPGTCKLEDNSMMCACQGLQCNNDIVSLVTALQIQVQKRYADDKHKDLFECAVNSLRTYFPEMAEFDQDQHWTEKAAFYEPGMKPNFYLYHILNSTWPKVVEPSEDENTTFRYLMILIVIFSVILLLCAVSCWSS